MDDKIINSFGYGEMYEWHIYPGDDNRFGRFVQFSESEPDKITLARNDKNVIGVASINYVETSDNADFWHKRYMSNKYGDIFMRKERLAVGQKDYDQLNEFAFIRTFPYEQYIPVDNPEYDGERKYVKRSNRSEWVSVIIKGKAIVKDNGKCEPGKYCTPIFSDIWEDAGSVVPADENSENKYYVISRVSEDTILIFVK